MFKFVPSYRSSLILSLCVLLIFIALARAPYVTPLKKNYTPQEVRHFLHTSIGTGWDLYGRERIIKWTSDIRIRCYGEVEAADVKTINYIAYQFKRLTKRPGIAMNDENANMKFFFIPEQQITFHLGDKHERQFEYGAICKPIDKNGVLVEAKIFIPAEARGERRDMLIKHEMAHCLGLMNHNKYPGSYLYQGSEHSQARAFHAMDKVALQLLYIPAVKPNMSWQQAEGVLRERGLLK